MPICRSLLAAVSLLLLATACRITEIPAPILDAEGRIVIYHGVNLANSAKYAPDFLPWVTRDDLARLPAWGFNQVRYLIFWEAIEPQQGVYDDVYLDKTIERIGWMRELGLDVVLDLHQDLFSGRFGGDGFPDWALDDGGYPFTPRSPWQLNYLEPAVRHAYDTFWKSDTLRAAYVAMVQHVLERIEGLPNVIGLDIMNEPFPCTTGRFEAVYLSRLYTDIQTMRNQHGFTTRLYFEPVIFTSAGMGSHLSFKPDPDAVYSPHCYDPITHDYGPYTLFAKFWTERTVALRVRDAGRMQTPLWFGEFGVPNTAPGAGEFLDDFLALMNRYQIGWSYYSYDKPPFGSFAFIDAEGKPNALLDHLSYVYAQRIAGRNLEFMYGVRDFELRYDPLDIQAPTVIYIPERLANVQVTINHSPCAVDPSSRWIEHVNAGAAERQIIHVAWD